MAVERLAPDAILASVNLTGAVTAIDEDPDSPDASWLTRTSANTDTDVRVSFPTPTPDLTGTQEFRVRVRKTSEATAPTATVELWQAGSPVSTLVAATTISSTAGVVLAGTFDPTGLDPASIECRVVGTVGGGSPSKRATVEVGAIEWNAQYVAPSTDRAAAISWGEIEVPTAPRSASISFAEMEVGTPPRTAAIAWAELETPEPPADQSAAVSWAELEAPDAPVNIDRDAVLSWGEMEVPTAPRAAAIAWAEMETGTPPRSVQVAWAVVEVPSVGLPPSISCRRGTITLMGVGA